MGSLSILSLLFKYIMPMMYVIYVGTRGLPSLPTVPIQLLFIRRCYVATNVPLLSCMYCKSYVITVDACPAGLEGVMFEIDQEVFDNPCHHTSWFLCFSSIIYVTEQILNDNSVHPTWISPPLKIKIISEIITIFCSWRTYKFQDYWSEYFRLKIFEQ